MIMPANIDATSLSWSKNTAKNHLTLESLIGRSSHHLDMGRSAFSSVKSLICLLEHYRRHGAAFYKLPLVSLWELIESESGGHELPLSANCNELREPAVNF